MGDGDVDVHPAHEAILDAAVAARLDERLLITHPGSGDAGHAWVGIGTADIGAGRVGISRRLDVLAGGLEGKRHASTAVHSRAKQLFEVLLHFASALARQLQIQLLAGPASRVLPSRAGVANNGSLDKGDRFLGHLHAARIRGGCRHGRRVRPGAYKRIQEIFCRLAANHSIRNLVRVSLVGIAGPAQTIPESKAHTAALLDRMSRLVSRSMEIGRLIERYVTTCGVGSGAQALAGPASRSTDMSLYRRDIVSSK